MGRARAWLAAAVLVGGCLVGGGGAAAAGYTAVPDAGAAEVAAAGQGLGSARVLRDLRYGPGASHLADLYLPRVRRHERTPVLVYVHGGGWFLGDRTAVRNAGMVTAMLDQGWAVLAINYRLVRNGRTRSASENPHPAQVRDVKRSIRWVKSISSGCVIRATVRTGSACQGRAGLNLDAETVVLSGFSAGGHLALLVGMSSGAMEPVTMSASVRRENSRVAAVVAVSPVTDMVHAATSVLANVVAPMTGCPVAGRICNPGLLARLTPATWIDPSDPPVYLAYGRADILLPPELHAVPIAEALGSSLGHERVWVDEMNLWRDSDADGVLDTVVAEDAHQGMYVNFAALASFLEQVRNRSIAARQG